MKVETGYQYIFISHDGYVQEPGVGYTLLKHYNNKEIVKKLMASGDGSGLYETLETSNFYNDDSEEEDFEKEVYPQEESNLNTGGNTYAYIYQDDKWYIHNNENLVYNTDLDSSNCRKDGDLILLEDCIKQLDIEDEERKVSEGLPFSSRLNFFDIKADLKVASKVLSPEDFKKHTEEMKTTFQKYLKDIEEFV